MAGRPVGAKTVRYRSSLVRESDGTYLASVRVPAELLVDIGAQFLRFSLNTKNLEEANVLLPYTARQIAKAMNSVFAEKRRLELFQGRDGSLRLDNEEAYVAVHTREQILADIRNACTPARFIHHEAMYPLDDYETRKLLAVTDCFILDFEIPMKRYSRAYWRLVARIDRLQHGEVASTKRSAPRSKREMDRSANGKRDATLIDTLTLFELDYGTAWSPTRRQEYEATLNLLTMMFGAETPIRGITRSDLRRLRSILEDLASNWRCRAKLRHLSLEDAARKSRELKLPRRSATSIKDTLEDIKTIMDFAVAEGLIEHIFSFNMHRGLPLHTSHPPYPFTVSQLNDIFRHPPLYDRPIPLEERDGSFWLPLIALWTGMRLSEIAQLWTNDVTIIEQIPVIRILPAPPGDDPKHDKRLKTIHSVRVMPIHPELERVGFVEFWRHAIKEGRIRLFPELVREGPTHSFFRVSRQLTAFVRSATHGDKRVSYRSFRHTFRDATRDADLSKDRARTLGGWGNKDVSEQYGIGGSIPRLYKDIQKIAHPGLDLSHLVIEVDAAT